MNHVERIREKWARGELCVGTNVALTDATVEKVYRAAIARDEHGGAGIVLIRDSA